MLQETNPHESLEREIRELSSDIKNKSIAEKREVIKNSLVEKIGLGVSSSNTQASSQQQVPAPYVSSILPQYTANLPEELKLKVEKLVDLAWHNGIDAAIIEARKNDPMVLDMLHDSLAGKIYEEMEKRGLL